MCFFTLYLSYSETSSENCTVQPAKRELDDTRQFPDGNPSNISKLFQSKSPVEPAKDTSSAALQIGQTASHATPLTVNISPEGNPKNVANHGQTSSSLLVARRDNYFPSHSVVFSSSRRKKTARKSIIPRKVSPTSSPNPSLASKSLHRIRFQREDAAHLTNLASRGNRRAVFAAAIESMRCKESMDSPGLCDSTENANIRASMEDTEEIDLASQHRENCSSKDMVPAFSVEDSAGFANFPALESSSTNGSSPAVSEDHPVIIDIHSDSRETSGGENDSDSNFVSSENSPPHNHPNMIHRSLGNRNDGSQASTEEEQHSHSTTPIVVLQNTVQVKTEPNDVLQSTNSISPEQSNEQFNLPHQGDNSEHSGAIHRVPTESYSVVMPTSSQDAHCSISVHQAPVPSLMPRVVNVMGASPDHDEHTGSSQLDSNDQFADGKEHSCDICHKLFDSANSVMRHKRSHTGDRPYICKICGWGFNLSGNLNQHLAIHQKVKPFKCVYCGKTFARSNVLKAHVRCHTGERPYQCQLCGSKFIIGHNLKKHMLTRHGIKEDDKIFSQNAPDDSDPGNKDQGDSMGTPMTQS